MQLPVYTLVFFGLAAMFAGNAGFYLSEVLRYPTQMANDPGNTFAMFADFLIALLFLVLGVIAFFKHSKYDKDNTPIGFAKK